MRCYLDTSVLVAAHTFEPETERVQAWLLRQDTSKLVISSWCLVESESALSIKERRGEIDSMQHAACSASIASFVTRLPTLVLAIPEDFEKAREFCSFAASGLRAGDALHLAIALRLKTTHFATLDRVLETNVLLHGKASSLSD